MLNEREVLTRFVKLERRVLTETLHTIPEVHLLFTLHKLERMARDLGTYNEEIVTKFYASYVDTLRGFIYRRARPEKQEPLISMLVRASRSTSPRSLSTDFILPYQ